MERLASLRELAGISQFSAARKAHIPRVRLSLAETNQLPLSEEQENRLRTILLRAIEARSIQLRAVLAAAESLES